MKRKRFVKLLMSRGYSRNEANHRAQAVVRTGATYEQLYFAVRVECGDSEALEALQEMFDRIAAAVKNISEAAIAAAKALTAAMPSLAEMARKRAAE